MTKCIICNGDTHTITDKRFQAQYDVCEVCEFIYESKEYHISSESERKVYDLHINTMENEGYVNIFKRIMNDFIKELNITRKVLEFGSGPTPIFKQLLEMEGYNVYDYDPFYNDNSSFKDHKYQLITSNEVAEHFTNPLQEFELLTSLLEPGGYLVISTGFRTMDEDAFLNWWYKRDTTHIAFYNMTTFSFLAEKFNLDIIKDNGKNTVAFKKK